VDAWITHHLQALIYTLGQLLREPLGTLLTAAVIAVALALPAGLYLVVENLQDLSRSWSAEGQLSLFLHSDIDDSQAEQLAQRLRQRSEVRKVAVISRAEALAEYRRLTGFNELLDIFKDSNPLPAVLVLHPRSELATPKRLRQLASELATDAAVELAQVDLEWLQRLHVITGLGKRALVGLAVLLCFGVLTIVGNTVRFNVHSRREEIEIAKLVGATDAFVRRPFLYTGVWYGLFGGILAWLLVTAALGLLQRPVDDLAALYHSDFSLQTLDVGRSFALLGLGGMLGLLASWASVGRQLKAIEPS
jgi:cell division transport system permease protein